MTEEEILRRIGESVLTKRRRLGLTQERLAALAGLRTSYISDIERGRRNFSIITILKLSQALGERPEVIFDLPADVTFEFTSDSD
ncbi:helix-turn-helix transcriptional regulator [Thalassolituus oleivorans]|uniref:helix-turn-helix transcriptional regulator n=1 Tax=Thalassolituus oleivorans TaxID=187493 RepID=UPI002408FB79|nr:helix-turn-helix transcriptional regulator [Thalassolituus oleivorans]MDF1640439.1 helix-turn-helix transcriptional regulator [Thalassolituus oleivorans]